MCPPPKGVAVDGTEECVAQNLNAWQNNTPFSDRVQDRKNTEKTTRQEKFAT
jgi:hypothetical protein